MVWGETDKKTNDLQARHFVARCIETQREANVGDRETKVRQRQKIAWYLLRWSWWWGIQGYHQQSAKSWKFRCQLQCLALNLAASRYGWQFLQCLLIRLRRVLQQEAFRDQLSKWWRCVFNATIRQECTFCFSPRTAAFQGFSRAPTVVVSADGWLSATGRPAHQLHVRVCRCLLSSSRSRLSLRAHLDASCQLAQGYPYPWVFYPVSFFCFLFS